MAQLKDTNVNGTLTVDGVNVNEKMELVDELNSKLINIFGNEDLELTITNGNNYSSVEGSVTRIGNVLRIHILATRSSAPNVGNIGNEVMATYKCIHNGKIEGVYNTSGNTTSSGAAAGIYTSGTSIDNNVLSFNIMLGSTTTNATTLSAYLIMPVILNLDVF